MDLNDIETLYLHRQSCREFSDKPVSEELIQKICELALLAPSAVNAQPWQLIAVIGEKKDEFVKAVQPMGMNKFASKAQALIVVAQDKSGGVMRVGEIVKENPYAKNDLGLLTAHLILAAEAAGLGTCILGGRDEDKLRALLGFKKDVHIPHVVAVGYSAEGYEVRPKKRKPLKETFCLLK